MLKALNNNKEKFTFTLNLKKKQNEFNKKN